MVVVDSSWTSSRIGFKTGSCITGTSRVLQRQPIVESYGINEHIIRNEMSSNKYFLPKSNGRSIIGDDDEYLQANITLMKAQSVVDCIFKPKEADEPWEESAMEIY